MKKNKLMIPLILSLLVIIILSLTMGAVYDTLGGRINRLERLIQFNRDVNIIQDKTFSNYSSAFEFQGIINATRKADVLRFEEDIKFLSENIQLLDKALNNRLEEEE